MLVPGNRLCGFASALPKVSNILIVNFRITIFSIYIILKGFLHLSGYIQIERKYAFTRNIYLILLKGMLGAWRKMYAALLLLL